VLGTLEPAIETDLYRFDAAAGGRLFFDVQARTGATSARWRLVDPLSNLLVERDFSGTGSDVDTLTMPGRSSWSIS
jgi:hypothetical protein